MTHQTLGDLLGDRRERAPEAPAVVVGGATTTYAQLHDGARHVASAVAREVRTEGVALLAPNGADWVEAYFGIAMAGRVTHALNTWLTAPELQELLNRSACDTLLVAVSVWSRDLGRVLLDVIPELASHCPDDLSCAQVPSLRRVVTFGAGPRGAIPYEQWKTTYPLTERIPDVAPNRAAVVVYTSGSSAAPKAVPLVHGDLLENGFQIGERMHLSDEDRVWLGSPLFWSYGCANALMATLTHGASLHVSSRFDPHAAIDQIDSEACTVAYLLPTIAHALLHDEGFDRSRLASVRTGLTIGSRHDLDVIVDQLGIEGICNVYGSTEVYGNCCVTPIDADLGRRISAQGPPLSGVVLRIVDPVTREVLAVDKIGEIEVRGRVTPGYLDPTGLANESAFSSDGYYRTGDLGSLDGDGWIHFFARDNEMIKTSGINVSPAEVEGVLAQHPQVLAVAVTAVPDSSRGEAVVAFLVLDGSSTEPGYVDEDALRSWCRERISSYKVPTRFIGVSALPMTATGKLDRRTLRRLGAGRDGPAASTGGPDGT